MLMFNKVSKIVKNFPFSFVLYLYTTDIMPKKIDKQTHKIRKRPIILNCTMPKKFIHLVKGSTTYKSSDINKTIKIYNPVKIIASFENLFIFFINYLLIPLFLKQDPYLIS